MVVADLRVVDEATTEGPHTRSGRERRAILVGHGRHHRTEAGGDVAREVAAVGARVGQQLVVLVERLRGRERLARRQTVQAVHVPLQLGQVVQQRRREAPRLGRDRFHLGAARAHAFDDPLRLDAVGRKPPRLGRRLLAAEPGAAVLAAVSGLGGETADHLEVVLGDELADRLLALDEQRQRRCLDATDREELAARQRGGSRQVHADEPVGAGASVRGIGQRVEVRCRAQRRQAPADGVGRQRRDPQPADRTPAAGCGVDVAEDELALAARVRGADDLAGLAVTQQPGDHVELVLRLPSDDQGPLGRQQRQRRDRPALPLGSDLRRLGQLDEVSDGPGDHVAVAAETAVAPFGGAEHARQVAGDGRLLRHHDDAHVRPRGEPAALADSRGGGAGARFTGMVRAA